MEHFEELAHFSGGQCGQCVFDALLRALNYADPMLVVGNPRMMLAVCGAIARVA